MIKYLAATAIVLSTCFAVQDASACPQSYKAIDSAIWIEARDSGDPARWVQYYVSAQCPENKTAARALLTPLLGDPDKPNSGATDQILLMGKFSGDQSQTVEKAPNGVTLKSTHQGAELYTFQMLSVTKVAKVEGGAIPDILFRNMAPPMPPEPPVPSNTPKDIAFWIRYRCQILNTHSFTPWFGDPTSPPGECAPGSGYTIQGIDVRLMGPYAKFFAPPSISSRPAGVGGAAELTFTVKLLPQYTSFMGMLTGNYVK